MKLPVELCQYSIQHKLTGPLQLYLALKMRCEGIIKPTSEELIEIGRSIGLNSRTAIRYELNKLLALNWIGHNKKTGWFFIRGFETLRLKYGFQRRSSAEFTENDIAELKIFVFCVVIQSLINEQKRKMRGGGRISRRSLQPPFNSFPIAVRALAKILNISISTVHELKKRAISIGYIEVYKNYKNTNLNHRHINEFRKANEALAHKAIKRDGVVQIRCTDTFKTNIKFKPRKKIELY